MHADKHTHSREMPGWLGIESVSVTGSRPEIACSDATSPQDPCDEAILQGNQEFTAFCEQADFSEKAQLAALILLRSAMRSLSAPNRPISFWTEWHDLRYDCLQLCAAIGESPAFARLTTDEKEFMRQRLLNPDWW